MTSLTRRFLIGIGLMTVVVTLLSAGTAFFIFDHELQQREVANLGDYVWVRARNEGRRFSDIANVHHDAARQLADRMKVMTPAQVDHLFEASFPLQADGTRRSSPDLFDGRMGSDGAYIHGVGAFLSHGKAIDAQERRLWAAALPVVASTGDAVRASYDNFYFYTPATRMVMFGPDRPDHLMFYRHNAPPNLDLSGEQMMQITLPKNNPSGRTRCTTLQRLVQDNSGGRLATACVTPVYQDGRMIGAFGSSIDLSGYFQRVIGDAVPGASNLIATGDGQLIAFPGFSKAGVGSERALGRREQVMGLRPLMTAIRKQGSEHGVVASPDGRMIVAYGLLRGPDWYFLVTYPKAAIAWSAARSASWILLVGMIAALAQTLMVVSIARVAIAAPLRRLVQSADATSEDAAASDVVGDLEARSDEIGLLARTLRAGRERVQDVLASLEQRVQERTAELEIANQEKSRFLANMSHELRTPLNGVIAVGEMLAREQTDPVAREKAELIVSSGQLLERVLSDILDFSKIEAGQMRLEPRDFDLESLVARIAELHRASAASKGLELVWSVAENASGAYRGDPVRITQVLSNLLSNAVKFTAAGRVELTVDSLKTGLEFSIYDTGIGFDAETGARLFRRFEQADASITRRFGGTGLGLAICRLLTEMMDGQISAESEAGRGACFTVTLPLERVAAVDEVPGEEADDVVEAPRRRILLAEDHPANQRVVQLILEASGHELVIVDNGLAALEKLKADTFDLVLMDMQMPEMDGLAATSALRRHELDSGCPRTPVVMLTANALDEHVAAGKAAGADLHLSKPIRPDALLAAVTKVSAERELAETEAA